MSEHLRRCASCRELERRLGRATPRDFIRIPPRVREQMWSRLDDALDEAWQDAANQATRAPREPTLRERVVGTLWRPTSVPQVAVLAYAALLLLAIGWGIGNWLDAKTLQAELAGVPAGEAGDGAPPATIPADQFRPASWSPPPKP